MYSCFIKVTINFVQSKKKPKTEQTENEKKKKKPQHNTKNKGKKVINVFIWFPPYDVCLINRGHQEIMWTCLTKLSLLLTLPAR